MDHQFLIEYFEFARSIEKGNRIISIITSDYNPNNIRELVRKHEEYNQAVDDIVDYIQTIPGLSTQQSKQLAQRIKKTETKKAAVNKSCVSLSNLLSHYAAIANASKISFVIVFQNGEYWNVSFTSSLRSDRMDTHSNRFLLSQGSERNILVVCGYPYQDESSISCINEIKLNPAKYGSYIQVVSVEELLDDLMYNIFKYKIDKSGNLYLVKPKDQLSIVNGERGTQIEHIYAKALANPINFELYKNQTDPRKREMTAGSFLPNQYATIIDRLLRDLNVDIPKVKSISCIPIGGKKYKSDVWVSIELSDGTIHDRGISIKSSSSESVSVNEKHATEFISDLGITDATVQNAIQQFETVKALKNLDKNYVSALFNYFSNDSIKRQLLTWSVIGGKNEPYKADYVLLHSYIFNDNQALGNAIKIYSCQEYIDEIMACDYEGTFGTHLSWTYKGNIQLKAPFIF